MQRQIKFRGLRLDGGGWVYGSLTYNPNNGKYWIGSFAFGRYYHVQVHSETVGQFTGLKDKNDVDIYEGDRAGEWYNRHVIFNNGMFMLTGTEGGGIQDKPLWRLNNSLSVTGNIHENKTKN